MHSRYYLHQAGPRPRLGAPALLLDVRGPWKYTVHLHVPHRLSLPCLDVGHGESRKASSLPTSSASFHPGSLHRGCWSFWSHSILLGGGGYGFLQGNLRGCLSRKWWGCLPLREQRLRCGKSRYPGAGAGWIGGQCPEGCGMSARQGSGGWMTSWPPPSPSSLSLTFTVQFTGIWMLCA